jgi:hypothetical protein
MIGYNCKVTDVKPTARALGQAKTPVWCEDEPEKCIKGPKGMIVFNQLEGNNINVDGNQKDGGPKSPSYNQKTGFQDGAQNDIFVDSQFPSVSMANRRIKIPKVPDTTKKQVSMMVHRMISSWTPLHSRQQKSPELPRAA